MTREPLVSPEVDLRDFPFTPIFRARLFGSSFHARASDSEWRAGVTLWLKSWDQCPAGSLPNDDIDLCRLAELGRDLRAWKKVKNGALHGWFVCSDGRLYHEVVAEGVNDAWIRKCSQRDRTAAARAAREAKKQSLSQTKNHSVTEEKEVCNSDENPLSQTQLQAPRDRDRDRDRDSKKDVVVDARASEIVLKAIEAWDDPNLRVHAGRVQSWLGAGADVEIDIIPTLKAVLQKCRERRGNTRWFPSSLNFFDQAVADAVERRTTPLPEGRHNGTGNRKSAESFDDQIRANRTATIAALSGELGASDGRSGKADEGDFGDGVSPSEGRFDAGIG